MVSGEVFAGLGGTSDVRGKQRERASGNLSVLREALTV